MTEILYERSKFQIELNWYRRWKEHILLNNNKQDQNKTSNVQVISRAANILRTLRDHSKGLSLSQITKEVGLARSTNTLK